MPADWKESPKYLSNVKDANFRWFGNELNKLWKILGRKMKNEVAVSVYSTAVLVSLFLCPMSLCTENIILILFFPFFILSLGKKIDHKNRKIPSYIQ